MFRVVEESIEEELTGWFYYWSLKVLFVFAHCDFRQLAAPNMLASRLAT